MTVSIRLKHSSVAAKVPLPADLADGELGLNINDTTPAVYLKDSAGAVVQVGGVGTEPDATETIKGVLEIATQAEVDAGTDDARAVTPLKLATAVPAATETAAGKAEIATQAQVDTGTDDLRIVTPLKLKTYVDNPVNIPQNSKYSVANNDAGLVGGTLTAAINAALTTNGDIAGAGDLRVSDQCEVTDSGNSGANVAVSVGQYLWDGAVWFPGGGNASATNGFRNVLMNGQLLVNQRGTNVTTAAVGDYGQDRWKVTAGGMTQIVEDGNYVPSTSYTLSHTGLATPITATSPASGNWDISTTHGDIPTSARSIQLEVGSAATDYELKPFGTELAMCQRYYESSYEMGVPAGTVTTNGMVTARAVTATKEVTVVFNESFTVTKRAVPTVTWYSTTSGVADRINMKAADNSSNNPQTVTASSNVNGPTSTTKVGNPAATLDTTYGPGNFYFAHYTADAEL